MFSIYILDICIPNEGWQIPQIFCEDTQQEEMNAVIREAQSKNYTVVTKRIHGMALKPLKEFLSKREL